MIPCIVCSIRFEGEIYMKKALISLLLGVTLCGVFSNTAEAKTKKPVKLYNSDCVVEEVENDQITFTNNSKYLVKSAEYVYEIDEEGFWDDLDEDTFVELDGFEKGETSVPQPKDEREPVYIRYTVDKGSTVYYVEWKKETGKYTVYDWNNKKLYSYKEKESK